MTCDDAVKAIPLSLYGELAFDVEDDLEGHLDECRACRTELARERLLHRSLQEAETLPTPAFLRECRSELHDQLQNARPARLPSWARGGIS